MYEIKVAGQFSAAHSLRGYKGKCERLHGHNWKVEVALRATKLDAIGMVVDFKDAKELLNDILKELDHSDLRSHPYFKKFNPTSENIARFIYGGLSKRLSKFGKNSLRLARVSVWETENSCASFYTN